jgi:N-acetyl-gamma-glutamyl-phosphate reductase
VVFFDDKGNDHGILGSNNFAQRDDMAVTVCGNDDRIVLISRFDNLGKGASGAAVQNFNIVTGQSETAGLKLGGQL